jgi:O-acetyl-ADP-ribose deacetylase
MIIFEVGDITKVKAEVIVNAANGIGVMGAGVAGALRNVCGQIIQ